MVEYLHTLFEILLQGRFVSSSWIIHLLNHSYIYQYGLLDISFILWVIIQYYISLFYLNFILFIFLCSTSLLVIHFIHISVYMSISISQFITPPPPPATFHPWCPYVCSLHLCLYFCPANRFICTIFLGSTYMH